LGEPESQKKADKKKRPMNISLTKFSTLRAWKKEGKLQLFAGYANPCTRNKTDEP